MRGIRRWAVAAVCIAATALVTACGVPAPTGGSARAPGESSPAAPAGRAASSGSSTRSRPVVVEHVHALVGQGDAILVGTHGGLLRIAPGTAPLRISDQPFDVKALTAEGGRLLASGHPAPATAFPDPLGLGQSTDGGRTWASVSQLGSTDFHKLQASGVRVWALAADGAVWRSVDAGRSWQVADTPPMGDIAVDPNDSERLVALTRTSVMLSRDAGANFGAWTGAPALTFVAWTTDGVYGVTPSGNIVRADGLGRPWQRRGTVPKDIQSIASNGADLVLATGRSLLTSRDGGRTFVMSARLR